MSRWVEREVVAYWRKLATLTAKEAGIPLLERVRVSAVIHRRALGVADEDNDRSRLKPLLDGLRDAGVVTTDTRKHVRLAACTETRAGVDGPGVMVIIRRDDAQALGGQAPVRGEERDVR